MSRLRKICAVSCTVWLIIVAIRINAAIHGHPGNRGSLAFAVVSAVCGVLGLYFALKPRGGGR